jgi:hypothetical protein
MKPIRIALALSTLAFAALGSAQVSKSGDGYTLRMKFTKGQKISYETTTTVDMAGMQPMKMPMTMTVTDVKDGIYTVKYSVGAIGGQKPQDITLKMNSQGKLVEGNAAGQALTGAGNVQLPTKPVKVGESWSSTAETPVMGSKMKVNSTYTFKGIKKVGGKDVAEIAIKMTSSGGAVGVTGTGTMTLMVSDGSLHGSTMNIKTSMGQGSGTASTTYGMKMTVVRK